MRRESSTVVALVGDVRDVLLAEVSRSPNVAVVKPADEQENGLETAARALRSASGRASPFVLVPADPLAAVAQEWAAMWDLSQEPRGGTGFEVRAGEAIAAWRAGRFELPDYYLVLTRAEGEGGVDHGVGLHLGPLRAARPRRVAVTPTADGPEQAARVLDALRSLPHGPWWPPVDELIDTARRFFAGGLAEGEGVLAGPPPG
jgi:hypothetical protein